MNAKYSRLPVGVKPHHSGSPGGLVNTRQQWSKYICGMLNSGLGRVLYGGIFDNGMVNGFMMSSYQRVHVALQLQEVLQRFEPRVPTELVSVQFVPIKEPFDKGVLRGEYSTLQHFLPVKFSTSHPG